jgi:hypothetical protein
MKTKNIKNAGTTLVELMVYMIVGLIVITATFKVLSKATNGYIHARAVSKAQYNARDGLIAMARDIASMGYKVYFTYKTENAAKAERNVDSVGLTKLERLVGPRYSQNDGNTAAFFFANGVGKESDTLEFFRIRVNDKGERIAREWIKYFLDINKNVLIRQLRVLKKEPTVFSDSWEAPTETIIASNVVALNFRFSKNGVSGDENWVSAFDETKRSAIRHVEAAILVKAHKSEKGRYGASQYKVGDRIYITPDTDHGLVHRIYIQTVEVPNNAEGLD